jgi:hypothetical protein
MARPRAIHRRAKCPARNRTIPATLAVAMMTTPTRRRAASARREIDLLGQRPRRVCLVRRRLDPVGHRNHPQRPARSARLDQERRRRTVTRRKRMTTIATTVTRTRGRIWTATIRIKGAEVVAPDRDSHGELPKVQSVLAPDARHHVGLRLHRLKTPPSQSLRRVGETTLRRAARVPALREASKEMTPRRRPTRTMLLRARESHQHLRQSNRLLLQTPSTMLRPLPRRPLRRLRLHRHHRPCRPTTRHPAIAAAGASPSAPRLPLAAAVAPTQHRC